MKKIIRLTGSELVKLIMEVMEDEPIGGADLLGRKYSINADGTVSIQDRTKKMVKVKLTTKIADINVAAIQKVPNGYKITGKKGKSKIVSNDKISQVISFVDTNSPSVIKSDSFMEPNLILQKV